MTKQVKKRYNQLKAADNFIIYLNTRLGNPHSLSGELEGYYAVNITANKRLIIRPKTDSLDYDSLKMCETVIVKGVLDYHGKKYEWLIP